MSANLERFVRPVWERERRRAGLRTRWLYRPGGIFVRGSVERVGGGWVARDTHRKHRMPSRGLAMFAVAFWWRRDPGGEWVGW